MQWLAKFSTHYDKCFICSALLPWMVPWLVRLAFVSLVTDSLLNEVHGVWGRHEKERDLKFALSRMGSKAMMLTMLPAHILCMSIKFPGTLVPTCVCTSYLQACLTLRSAVVNNITSMSAQEIRCQDPSTFRKGCVKRSVS